MQNLSAVGAVVNVVCVAAVGYFLQWSSRQSQTSQSQTSPVSGRSSVVLEQSSVEPTIEAAWSHEAGSRRSTTLVLIKPEVVVPPSVVTPAPPVDVCQTTKAALHLVISQVVLPIVIATALWKVQFSREYLEIPLYLGGVNLLVWAVTHFFLGNKSQAACSAFGNVTYVGLPILSGLYGLTDQVLVTVGICEITTTLLNILTSNGRDRRFLRNPCLWAIAIGIGLRVFPYPQMIDPLIKNLAVWMSLSMIMVLGMTIQLSMKWDRFVWAICAIKLVAVPSMMLLISRNPLLILEAAMPCQLLTTVLYKDEKVSGYCFASILLSLITIPIWSAILN
jgi:predicted permease